MERWTGVLRVSLDPNKASPCFKVAASLLLSPSSQTLAVPSVNAIFFNGDRVEGTGNPIIERLSDSRNIAKLLVAKLGLVNAWVVDASTFNGPFAVYKEFIPTVNSYGEPKRYDPDGFPASSLIAAVLSECVDQVRSLISGSLTQSTAVNMCCPPSSSSNPPPKTIILGFSKGGTVVNQILTELAHLKLGPSGCLMYAEKYSSKTPPKIQEFIYPTSKEGLLLSISEFHYVDVGLNRTGAYLIDHTTIKKVAKCLSHRNASVRFVLHGTPRQWCDRNRPWIRKEKDTLLQLLEDEARRSEGKLQVFVRFYFADVPPSLQMHFEIIDKLDMS